MTFSYSKGLGEVQTDTPHLPWEPLACPERTGLREDTEMCWFSPDYPVSKGRTRLEARRTWQKETVRTTGSVTLQVTALRTWVWMMSIPGYTHSLANDSRSPFLGHQAIPNTEKAGK